MRVIEVGEWGLLLHSEALEALKQLPSESVDALVTDPPAGIAFMNREWDKDKGGRDAWVAWFSEVMAEVFRVLKPGAHGVVWSIPRTQHWTAWALENAGFEIADNFAVLQVFGQGFPKSLSVHKHSVKAVESRYGNQTCSCLEEQTSHQLDPGAGSSPGNDQRCCAGSGDRIQRGGDSIAADCLGIAVVSIKPSGGPNTMRGVRYADSTASQGSQAGEASLLQSDLCRSGSKTTGQRDAALRSGLEECSGQDSEAGSGVPPLREDGSGERRSTARSSPEAVSVRGNEQPGEPGGLLQSVPSGDRTDDGPDFVLDPDRSEPRRLVLDDCAGRQNPVARVCSWCGYPDQAALDSLEPLGTALKPAYEPWILIRKPIREKNIARNVLTHGTGAMNLGACEVGRDPGDVPGWHKSGADGSKGFQGEDTFKIRPMNAAEINARCGDKGRHAPNLILQHADQCVKVGTHTFRGCPATVIQGGKDGGGYDVGSSDGTRRTEFVGYGDENGMETAELWACVPGCPVRAVDEMSGVSKSGTGRMTRKKTKGDTTAGWGIRGADNGERGFGDKGTASRYFPSFQYVPKPSRSEKEAGLDGLDAATLNRVNPGGLEAEPRFAPVQVKNNHPTVKSIDFCRWLVRLVNPPGGTVIDPFLGSGSIGCAAGMEGAKFIGIDQGDPPGDPRYCEIARLRMLHWAGEGEE